VLLLERTIINNENLSDSEQLGYENYSSYPGVYADLDPHYLNVALELLGPKTIKFEPSVIDLVEHTHLNMPLAKPHAESIDTIERGHFHVLTPFGWTPDYLFSNIQLNFSGSDSLSGDEIANLMDMHPMQSRPPTQLTVETMPEYPHAFDHFGYLMPFEGNTHQFEISDKKTTLIYKIPRITRNKRKLFSQWNKNRRQLELEIPEALLKPWLVRIYQRIGNRKASPYELIHTIKKLFSEEFVYYNDPSQDIFQHNLIENWINNSPDQLIRYWHHIHDPDRVPAGKMALGQCQEIAFVAVQLFRYFGISAVYATGFGVDQFWKTTQVAHVDPAILWPDENGQERIFSFQIGSLSRPEFSLDSLVRFFKTPWQTLKQGLQFSNLWRRTRNKEIPQKSLSKSQIKLPQQVAKDVIPELIKLIRHHYFGFNYLSKSTLSIDTLDRFLNELFPRSAEFTIIGSTSFSEKRLQENMKKQADQLAMRLTMLAQIQYNRGKLSAEAKDLLDSILQQALARTPEVKIKIHKSVF